MPRAGLSPHLVVAEAARLADEIGYDKLTLAAVATHFGVALPSLYKHVKGLDGLQSRLATLAVTELTEQLAQVAIGRSGRDALAGVATAYRAYARRHPGRYRATQRAPDPDDHDHVEAAGRTVAVIYAVLAGYGITGDDAVHATRAVRSALHGFVLLESGGGFGIPVDVDRSFTDLVDALHRALSTWPGAAR